MKTYQSKHLICILNGNNSILGHTSVVVRMVGYVKYVRSIPKPPMNFGKLKPVLMMTTLVKCSNSTFMVKSTRNLLIENIPFILCFRKGNIKAQITARAKNSKVQKREHNRRKISKFIKTFYFMCRKK